MRMGVVCVGCTHRVVLRCEQRCEQELCVRTAEKMPNECYLASLRLMWSIVAIGRENKTELINRSTS